MPVFCELKTNLTYSDILPEFEVRLSGRVSQVLTKAIEKVAVVVTTDLRMCKSGDSSPMCILTITSNGIFNAFSNSGYITKLTQFLEKELRLPPNRISVIFMDNESFMMKM